MRIALVGPAQAIEGGNTTTLRRWRRVLEALGHTVGGDVASADLLVALHARRSADAIAAFGGPVVVAAAGTDLYPMSPEAAASFARADRVVVLNPAAVAALPEVVRDRARVILQSVEPLPSPPARDPPWTVAVVGHLRAIKDPLVFARAAARLPRSSRIRVVQVGGVLEPALAVELAAEVARNPRLRSVGAVPRDEALRIVASAHLLGIGSVLEGGANVVGEALALGTPPVATRIDGNVGLLGADWPALFEVGDVDGLAALLDRWETDPALREALTAATARLAPEFAPDREREAWAAVLTELNA